jgi:sugar lactone lactonase YvrE
VLDTEKLGELGRLLVLGDKQEAMLQGVFDNSLSFAPPSPALWAVSTSHSRTSKCSLSPAYISSSKSLNASFTISDNSILVIRGL